MSHDHAATGEHKAHVLPYRIYIGVWAGLLVLTVLTVAVSYSDFGILNIVIAMGVATVKASLVTLFFMHLKYDEKFNQILFAGTMIFFTIFIVLTLADNAERGRVDPIEANLITPVPSRAPLRAHGAPGSHAGADSAHAPADSAHAAADSAGAPADSAHAPADSGGAGH